MTVNFNEAEQDGRHGTHWGAWAHNHTRWKMMAWPVRIGIGRRVGQSRSTGAAQHLRLLHKLLARIEGARHSLAMLQLRMQHVRPGVAVR